MSQRDEEKLLTHLIQGDPEAFDALITEYQDRVVSTCARFVRNLQDAEDVAQEVFLEVYQSVGGFRGQSRLSTWIYRIATNVSMDHFKRKTTRQAKAAVSLEDSESDGEWIADAKSSSPEQLAAQSEMADCVHGYVLRLSPSCR